MNLRDDYATAKRRLSERAERISKSDGYTRQVKKLRLLLELVKEQTAK